MSLRILHTSDVHLGATFRVLGERGREQRRQLEATFARVISLAIDEGVHLVLIAGDLFDSLAAARATMPAAVQELRRLGTAGIPAVVIAGNHDPFGEGSVSLWRDLVAACPGTSVPGHDLETRLFPDLDLAVVGRSARRHLSTETPLHGLPISRPARFVVAVAHGSVQRPDLPARFDLMSREEIARSGVDYLALGDWHSSREASSGGVTAWYSGAPEMIDLDEPDSGHVCLVTLRAPGDVQVERRRVGRRSCARLVLDLATVGGPDGVTRAIRERLDPDLALTLVLSGLCSPADRPDAEALREAFGGEFFRLEIRDDSHLRADAIDPDRFPEKSVLGQFVRLMRDRLADREADGEARGVAEDALHLGVALLEGKEILG
jgi:DNA repair protein SbcD/Mre11